MDSLKTYYDFAEDDYQYLREDYERGRVANYMAGMAQNICERYLKHVIDKYVLPETANEEYEKKEYLRKHNLNALLRYINAKTDFQISRELCKTIRGADGYYFSTRYPGDESIQIDKDVIEECMSAVETCRDTVRYIIKKKEQEETKAHPDRKTAVLEIEEILTALKDKAAQTDEIQIDR